MYFSRIQIGSNFNFPLFGKQYEASSSICTTYVLDLEALFVILCLSVIWRINAFIIMICI